MKHNNFFRIFFQKSFKSLLLTLLFTCTSIAAAQEPKPASETIQNKWVAITLNIFSFNIFYEKDSIVVSPENKNWRTLNVLFQFFDDKKGTIDDSVINNSEVYTITIDCIHQSARLDQHVYYDERWGQGKVAGTDTLTDDFKPATAEIDRYFLDLVCPDMPKPSLVQP